MNIIRAIRQKLDPQPTTPHRGFKKYSTPVGCMATVEPDLLPPDPDPVENAPTEPDYIEGLSMADDTGHELLPKARA